MNEVNYNPGSFTLDDLAELMKAQDARPKPKPMTQVLIETIQSLTDDPDEQLKLAQGYMEHIVKPIAQTLL
jgi:hypothetical protein